MWISIFDYYGLVWKRMIILVFEKLGWNLLIYHFIMDALLLEFHMYAPENIQIIISVYFIFEISELIFILQH